MSIFRFSEVCGKYQGQLIDIEADSIEDAIKEFGADDVIPCYGRFKRFYFENVFNVRSLDGNPAMEYIVHRK